MKSLSLRTFLISSLWLLASASMLSAEPIFKPVKIDGPDHDPANHTYWFGPFSECASVADLDGDGDLDIAAGRNWYEAPDWIKHADFREGARVNGPEVENNAEFVMDVDYDGDMDIVSSGWMRDMGIFWYENPGPKKVKSKVKWKQHRIHTARSLEGGQPGDIDGDGDEDILCNHWTLEPGQGVTWLEHTDKAPWFVEHIIGSEGDTHGNALGDINMDGRMDIVTKSGWYEGPKNPTVDDWPFHPDYEFKVEWAYSAAALPFIVYDVDSNGLNDLLVGSGHTYGLSVIFQRKDKAGKNTFTQEWIERDIGQFHTMAMGDLDGDGSPDLLTGKRLFAHHGRDVSCYDPLAIFWYDMKEMKLNRHVMAFNYLMRMEDDITGSNPVPQFVPSAGMRLNINDMNDDGRNDAVVCGKGGLYIFYNFGEPVRQYPVHRLPPEDNYPTWEQWRTMPTPEPAPIPRVIHGTGPAKALLDEIQKEAYHDCFGYLDDLDMVAWWEEKEKGHNHEHQQDQDQGVE